MLLAVVERVQVLHLGLFAFRDVVVPMQIVSGLLLQDQNDQCRSLHLLDPAQHLARKKRVLKMFKYSMK